MMDVPIIPREQAPCSLGTMVWRTGLLRMIDETIMLIVWLRIFNSNIIYKDTFAEQLSQQNTYAIFNGNFSTHHITRKYLREFARILNENGNDAFPQLIHS
jgi:hypothetical protein